MVRYPHIATVTITSVYTSDGEYSDAENNTYNRITGRLDRVNPRRIKTIQGDYIEASKKFFTKDNQVTGATHLSVNGTEYRILEWQTFQNHSEIWLD